MQSAASEIILDERRMKRSYGRIKLDTILHHITLGPNEP